MAFYHYYKADFLLRQDIINSDVFSSSDSDSESEPEMQDDKKKKKKKKTKKKKDGKKLVKVRQPCARLQQVFAASVRSKRSQQAFAASVRSKSLQQSFATRFVAVVADGLL